MKWFSGARGLVVRMACAGVLAFIAGIGTLAVWPGWVWSIAASLHEPLIGTLNFLQPSRDSYEYYVPVGFNLDFVLFLAFAMTVYIGILYVPTLALEICRITQLALQTPAPFIAYAMVGGLVGGIVGLSRWAEFGTEASWDALCRAVMTGGTITGWSAAVIRCAIERRHIRTSQ